MEYLGLVGMIVLAVIVLVIGWIAAAFLFDLFLALLSLRRGIKTVRKILDLFEEALHRKNREK